ncbi:MAG: GntR family transcriptional regulator [Bacteroidota bacterium]
MDEISEPLPKYYQIYEKLLGQIKNGKFEEFDRFYSDTELVEKYNVSRGTIRESVKLLIQQGYLVREQGKGTFVRKPKIEQDSDKLMGFTELMKKNNIEPAAQIVKKEIVDIPLKLTKMIGLEEDAQLVNIVRVRFGDEQPLIIERSYFDKELFAPIFDLDLEANSIYELLYNHTSTRLGEAKQQISAVSAGQEEMELLGVELNAPLLLMKRLIKTKDGNFFQYSEDMYRSDRINFATTTKPYDRHHDNQGVPLGLENNGW